jgi:2-dehydropantoate 2-reductase
MEEYPVLIVGSGAMACMYAARLTAAGQKVCMVDDWLDGIRTICRQGITLYSVRQNIHANIQTVLPGETAPACQLAIVLVKSWQTGYAAGILHQCLLPDGIALTLQNGLGNDDILKNTLGDGRVLTGVTTHGAFLESPAVVHGFEKGKISVQETPGSELAISVFKKAGYEVGQEKDLSGLVWGKLILNAAVNPLTALLNIQNGALLGNPQAMEVLQMLLQEAVEVSRRLEIRLPYTDPLQQVVEVLKATSANYSSMAQDLRRGAPTEIEQINGAIVHYGKLHGVSTPYHHCVTNLVRAKVATQ